MSLKSMLVRGTVIMADAARKLQTLQVRLTAGEIKDGAEHFEAYGFTSHPQAGAEVLTAFLGGDRSHAVVLVASDRRYRIKELQPGEVAIYTDEGDKVHFKRGRIINVETDTLNIKATSGVHFDTPVITQTGRIESDGDQVAGGISQIEHLHDEVQKGTDQSGQPVGGAG
ncbi:phage baseplate assembly protein V [Pseudomonas sp. ES3]|uniref:phage baseplate assembly protein V n=1 Tax=Pseudomonas sp. ES3 TaxID=3424776 RepID=UPI003D34ABCE